MSSKFLLLTFLVFSSVYMFGQSNNLWLPDLENGNYKNPIIYADYSDPDAIRVGDDYYMVSSSFSHFPGLPVLHSKDLVNWELIGHAAQEYPAPNFDKPQHGNAIWAPSLRYHKGEFYIYFGDPDRGVFMTKTKDPAGEWEPLKLIREVTGWIDCCPFWDEDGQAYLVHAFANSRCGIKSLIAINKMNSEGTEVLDHGVLVFNGQKNHITIEGPKLYKRNGFYYIFAPAGGVKPGWQTILRSESIFGPYEDKIVLEQGSTNINGPHQGAWVTTQTGEDWFIHFQDRYAYGRVVHLQPMSWDDDWPVMGNDYDDNGIGEPVREYKKPDVGNSEALQYSIPTTDEFNQSEIGLQWQWQCNFNNNWYSLTENIGYFRLFSAKYDEHTINLWDIGRLCLQKFPAPDFQASTEVSFEAKAIGEKAGLLIFGVDYAYIAIEKTETGNKIAQVTCTNSRKGGNEKFNEEVMINGNKIFFKVTVEEINKGDVVPKVMCNFYYSTNNKTYKSLGKPFEAKAGRWVGAKTGMFSIAPKEAKQTGYADFNYFRFTKL